MLLNRCSQSFLLAALLVAGFAASAQAQAGKSIDFNRDIKPILSNNCFQCHGPDPDERKGGKDGLRLDTHEGAIADQDGSFAIVPGKPEKSTLIARIATHDPDELMPPKSTGKKIPAKDLELLKEWIRQGAKYAGHWSYMKPVRVTPPGVKDGAWPKNDIDRFLLHRLEREKLVPMPEADRYALIRRLSLDLTGLPPTIEEVDQYLADKDPQAYEKLVDRLLAKETYGEHWAHFWLDLARYADSAGYADDPPRKIWMYRDYVIRSLNANKSFDQFTLEQIAGDLLPNPTQEQLIATAFHRNTLTNNEGGTNDEEFRNVAVVDRVNTTMAVWMGTTIHCAQCHTHKYDPLTQDEYFKLFAFFNSTEDADRTDESPLLAIETEEQKQQRSTWQGELAGLQGTLKMPTAEIKAGQAKWEAAFPHDLKWLAQKPASVTSQAGLMPVIAEDASVKFDKGAKTDTFTVELTPAAGSLRALRLETLPDDLLPSKGPGHAGGNFVITKLSAMLKPPAGQTLTGRYVRIELPGKQKYLSLAEVQVFQGADNIAPRGEAKQSSTAYDGPAKLAIDGNTNGDYNAAKSTTHTDASDNPWWEVDLKSEQRIDRLIVWNRTDGNVGDRLKDFRVVVLNDKHEQVWEQVPPSVPHPNLEISLSGERAVEFTAAVADFAQKDFQPGFVLKNPDAKNKGWAVGGAIGLPHSLILVAKGATPIPAGTKLVVTIEQNSNHANHTLGKFRLSLTEDARAADWGATPSPVIAALTTPADKRTPAELDTIQQHYLSLAPELAATRKRIGELEKSLADLKPETVPIQRELAEGKRRKTRVQLRGNFLDLGNEVTEGTPAVFPPLPAGPVNRLALAKWLIDEQNPLTARVIANRYWEQIFGIGIVSTSEEFGSQGEMPFHPELLDYLATEMVRLKWDTKAFIKLLVTSAAYRQSSRVTPELTALDPENRLLARGPRFRLSAEMIRDQALAASGLLSAKKYGPPVKPMQPNSGLSAAFGGGIDWKTSDGEDKYRRGLYTTWRRSNPYPSMATFDAPNREVCTVRRVRTNTPLQALVTLNDPVYVESAQALARRIINVGNTPAERATLGFRLVLARPPSADELARLVKLYEESREKFAKNEKEAIRLATEPLGPASKDMAIVDLAAWTVVGNVLLNLDETLMKR